MITDSSFWLIIWFGAVFLISQFAGLYKPQTVLGKERQLFIPEIAVIVILPIILTAGFRDFYFADTGSYVKFFKNMPASISGIPGYMEGIEKDKGFSLFSCLLKLIIGNRPRIYLIIISALQGTALLVVFRRFSENYLLSLFLFVASTDFISWMNNGIRQFLAVAIIFISTELILKRKYIPAVLLILFAALFHATALMMLPIIFIISGRAWNKRTIVFILCSLIALAAIDQFTDILEELLLDTQYETVVSDWDMWEDDGTNILRVLVYSVPAIFSVICRKYIIAANDPMVNLCTNASIISAGIYIISSATSGIFIGRLPIYVSLYGYILLPWLIKNCFTRQSARLITAGVVLCYLVFYLYAISVW